MFILSKFNRVKSAVGVYFRPILCFHPVAANWNFKGKKIKIRILTRLMK